jgi:hypothetical protein
MKVLNITSFYLFVHADVEAKKNNARCCKWDTAG